MDGVDSQVTGPAIGLGLASFTQRILGPMGMNVDLGVLPVGKGLTQIVDMGHRNIFQPEVLGLAEHPVGSLQYMLSGLPT